MRRDDKSRWLTKKCLTSQAVSPADIFNAGRLLVAADNLTLTLPTPQSDWDSLEFIVVNDSATNAILACTNGFFNDTDSVTIASGNSIAITCGYDTDRTYRWNVFGIVAAGTDPASALTAAEVAGIQASATPITGTNAAVSTDDMTTAISAALSGADALSSDEVAAITGANSPSATNPFMTEADVPIASASSMGALVAAADAKVTPIGADSLGVVDSADGNVLKRSTITQLMAVTKETVATIGTLISGASAKNPPIDADIVLFADTEDSNTGKKATWTQVKAFLKTYFDTQYPAETVTTLGAVVNGATAKNPPIDADLVGFVDTEDSNNIKKATWTQVKAFLKTYFDTLYTTIPTVATFSPTLGWSGGAPTVTGEVYRQQTLNKLCIWHADVSCSDGANATTMTLTFDGARVPTDVNMKVPIKALVSVNAGAFVEKVATLDCEDGTPANRKVTVSTGTLTTGQACRILLRGEHEIA